MLQFEQNVLSEEIERLAEELGRGHEALIPMLQRIQAKHNHISDFAQQEIARALDIHPVEVFSVISFYSFLDIKPQGRNIVRLCRTIVCDLAGKEEVEKAVQRELGIKFGETTHDKKYTLTHTNCLGMCDQGPAMLVNNTIYTALTPEKASLILSEIK